MRNLITPAKHGFSASCGLLLALLAQPAIAGVPLADDLQRDAREAQRRAVPMVVFFTDESCEYCRTVEELYLAPLSRDSAYAEKIILRKVRIDSAQSLRTFDGSRTDHHAFAGDQGAGFVPLLRFYDHTGRELIPPLVGYTGPDFYAGYLEQAIEDARARTPAIHSSDDCAPSGGRRRHAAC